MNFKVGAGINIKCEDEYYRYLSFSNNCLLEKIITYIQKQINVFSRKMIAVYT